MVFTRAAWFVIWWVITGFGESSVFKRDTEKGMGYRSLSWGSCPDGEILCQPPLIVLIGGVKSVTDLFRKRILGCFSCLCGPIRGSVIQTLLANSIVELGLRPNQIKLQIWEESFSALPLLHIIPECFPHPIRLYGLTQPLESDLNGGLDSGGVTPPRRYQS